MEHTICTSIHPPYLWKEQVTDPYLLLREFFDYTTIELQHLYTQKFVKAACSNEYVKDCPGQFLGWYEKTTVLFYAANLVHQSNYEKDIDIGIDVSKLPWKLQPHHLADYEVKDPYIAIESFFEFMSYDQWLIELHTWLHAAMFEHSVLEEVSRSTETITLLHKLADAMWMLHIKTNGIKIYTNDESEEVNEEAPGDDDAITSVRKAAHAFFDVQPAADSKKELWRMTKLAVCHHTDPDRVERDNMIYLYELLCGLIDVLERLDNERVKDEIPRTSHLCSWAGGMTSSSTKPW